MDTQTRGNTGIVHFILTLVSTVIIATGLIWVTTSDGVSDWATGFTHADVSWSQNITQSAYSQPHGQIEEHIQKSQETIQKQVRQSQERLNDFLNRN